MRDYIVVFAFNFKLFALDSLLGCVDNVPSSFSTPNEIGCFVPLSLYGLLIQKGTMSKIFLLQKLNDGFKCHYTAEVVVVSGVRFAFVVEGVY